MLDLILSPFEYTFMQKAFLISIGVAIPMSIISCYLILKGWALMGDAISHAILPGIVISYIFGIALSIGAFFAGLFCALTSGYIKNNSKLKNDSILGIVFSGMFALGLILYLKIETDIHLDHILFGNILGLSWNDVINSIALGIICALFIYFQRFDLMLNIFDSQHATAIGFNVKKLNYIFLAILSLIIVASLKSTGIILGIAMLIIPGSISYLISKNFFEMMKFSLFISICSSLIGVYISFFIDSAPAPTIVLILASVFIICFLKKMKLKTIKSSL